MNGFPRSASALALVLALVLGGCECGGGGLGGCPPEVCNGLDDDCDGETDEGDLWSNKAEFCYVGTGACQAAGVFICDENDRRGATVCSGRPGEPREEVCNRIDDDCDGQTDEEAPWRNLGELCTVVEGGCQATGIWLCDEADRAGATICSASTEATDEVCDGYDNDCDGETDEGEAWADLGTWCSVGTGACARSGIRLCDAQDPAGPTRCIAEAAPPAEESCNGLDDDCDGETDEGWSDLGLPCLVGLGVCQAPGIRTCDPANPQGPTVCNATPGAGSSEVCNGLDDDCDGVTDEEAQWADKGAVCTAGQGLCERAGLRACNRLDPAGPTICDAPQVAPAVEICNGADDDCDGAVDEDPAWAEVGAVCQVGSGSCLRTGVMICDPASPAGAPVCSAVAGSAGVEVCNGLDDDCDGQTDEGAAWETKGTVCVVGQGQCAHSGVWRCDPMDPAGAVICSVQPKPAGTEVCNGLDDDCDGDTDEDAPWSDKGEVCRVGQGLCEATGTRVCDAGDLSGPTVCSVSPKPAQVEACDGLDNDCDGETDEGALWSNKGTICQGGLGACASTGVFVCDAFDPSAATVCSAQPSPSQTEICDGLDNDCDGEIDEEALWADRGTVCTQGTGSCARTGVRVCDAGDPAGATVCSVMAAPPGTEACNGLDDDCDGETDEDWATLGEVCRAGQGSCERLGTLRCDASDPAGPAVCSAVPLAPGIEVCNGLDDDCDGETDEVQWTDLGAACSEGVGTCARGGVRVCDSGDPAGPTICSAQPGTAGIEVCNGLDDDCDGQTDEGWGDLGSGCSSGQGVCTRPGVRICDPLVSSGPTVCSASPGTAGTEVCNGLDDDCDGDIDEEGWSDLGEACTEGLGACQQGGVRICDAASPGGPTVCSALAGTGRAETCNGLDDDCDGAVDEDWTDKGSGCTRGEGVCAAPGVRVCDLLDPAGPTVCSATPSPPGEEVCDGLDNDCDGATDELAWPDKGQVCTVGVGACAATGIKICDAGAPAGPTVCSEAPKPAAAEVCNGLDDDCDGTVDEGALWDAKGAVCGAGLGACARSGTRVCDPSDPAGPLVCTAVPGDPASETCNELDDDCDGATDEDWPAKGSVCTVGLGTCRDAGVVLCALDGSGTSCSAVAGDPGVETCNGLDDDCDGSIDEDLAAPACDLQLGVCQGATAFCGGDRGWLACDRGRFDAAYELVELSCDGLDNDCDGVTDEVDADGDGHVNVLCTGYTGPLPVDDCNDSNAAAHPGLVEICGDGLDNDCDLSADNRDADGDLRIDAACGGTDCDDTDPSVHPGALERCNGVDDDCNGLVDDKDRDVDGYVDVACVAYPGPLPATDCDDANVGVNPAMDEVCGNLLDEDCSGAVNDKDVDGDGFVDSHPLCGGDDCNDGDPMVHPGATEVRDGKDNDCDPDGRADEGLIGTDAVVITEIFYDSSQVPDENYEWFEVFNPGDRPVNMITWLVRDQPSRDQEIAVINQDVLVEPRTHAVLCRTGSPLYNGGVLCDYEYGYLQLANTADELILEDGGTIVDEVWYDAGWPSANHASLNRDPDAYATGNNQPAGWCAHPATPTLPSGDRGSPGAPNVACSGSAGPQVIAVHPDHGLVAGGTPVRLVGSRLLGAIDVRVGGASCQSFTVVDDSEVHCVTPSGPTGLADLQVITPAGSDVLAGAFTQTREAGPGEGADEALMLGPSSLRLVRDRWSRLVTALVTEAGITGLGCPPASEYPPGTLKAELGFGPEGGDPRSDGTWQWFPAFCAGTQGGADLFIGTMTTGAPGVYSYAYRFSVDGGVTWTYADLDGSNNGFDHVGVGRMIVD